MGENLNVFSCLWRNVRNFYGLIHDKHTAVHGYVTIEVPTRRSHAAKTDLLGTKLHNVTRKPSDDLLRDSLSPVQSYALHHGGVHRFQEAINELTHLRGISITLVWRGIRHN